MSKSTGESEHLRDMLVGNILSVQPPEIIKTGLLYVAIGIFHYVFRKQFLLISTDPHGAIARGICVNGRDRIVCSGRLLSNGLTKMSY